MSKGTLLTRFELSFLLLCEKQGLWLVQSVQDGQVFLLLSKNSVYTYNVLGKTETSYS